MGALSGFVTQAITLITGVEREATEGTISGSALLTQTCGTPFLIDPLWWIEAFAVLIIPWIFAKLGQIAATLAVYSIVIEIGLRRVFAPLAVYDVYKEGFRSMGGRYMKKWFGALLKVIVCLAVGMLQGRLLKIINDSGYKGLEACFAFVAINLTLVALLFKAGEYTNDIVGA
jgi:hypothetical protein